MSNAYVLSYQMRFAWIFIKINLLKLACPVYRSLEAMILLEKIKLSTHGLKRALYIMTSFTLMVTLLNISFYSTPCLKIRFNDLPQAYYGTFMLGLNSLNNSWQRNEFIEPNRICTAAYCRIRLLKLYENNFARLAILSTRQKLVCVLLIYCQLLYKHQGCCACCFFNHYFKKWSID